MSDSNHVYACNIHDTCAGKVSKVLSMYYCQSSMCQSSYLVWESRQSPYCVYISPTWWTVVCHTVPLFLYNLLVSNFFIIINPFICFAGGHRSSLRRECIPPHWHYAVWGFHVSFSRRPIAKYFYLNSALILPSIKLL